MPDHPRIRGEHAYLMACRSSRLGSSPHTRGALPAVERQATVKGIIPAYAGSTEFAGDFEGGPVDHPRIRGEHIQRPRVEFAGDGSSPHTRGAPPTAS